MSSGGKPPFCGIKPTADTLGNMGGRREMIPGLKSDPAAFSMRFLRLIRPIHLPGLKAAGSIGSTTHRRLNVAFSNPPRLQVPVVPRGWSDVFHQYGDSNANALPNLPPVGHRGRADAVVCPYGRRIRRSPLASRSRSRSACIRDQPSPRARNLHRELEFGEHNPRPDDAGQRRSRCPHHGLL